MYEAPSKATQRPAAEERTDRDAASTSECNVMLHALSRAWKCTKAGAGEKKLRLFELAKIKNNLHETPHTRSTALLTVDTYHKLRLITPASLSLFCVDNTPTNTLACTVAKTYPSTILNTSVSVGNSVGITLTGCASTDQIAVEVKTPKGNVTSAIFTIP